MTKIKVEYTHEKSVSRRLNELGYKSLVTAIYENDGSFPKFRKIIEGHVVRLTLDQTLERAYEFDESFPKCLPC